MGESRRLGLSVRAAIGCWQHAAKLPGELALVLVTPGVGGSPWPLSPDEGDHGECTDAGSDGQRGERHRP
jgi:hypothetical protein